MKQYDELANYKIPLANSPEFAMTVAKSIINPVTGDSICYTFRPRLRFYSQGEHKFSAVAECVYEINLNPQIYNIGTLHTICEEAHNWFVSEVNKKAKCILIGGAYNPNEIHQTLLEALTTK